MSKNILIFFCFLFFLFYNEVAQTQVGINSNDTLALTTDIAPTELSDTVTVGIYVTSIYDIDFKQSQYSINLWLWLKYERPEFDFTKNLEIPMAKSFEQTYVTTDTLADGSIYTLMKLSCVMRDYWKIDKFPFDHQRIMFWIENSQFTSDDLVFKADMNGEQYSNFLFGPQNTSTWEKDSLIIKTDIREYKTDFGFSDPSMPALEENNLTSRYPKMSSSFYARYSMNMLIHRNSWELFLKLFIGMYLSFLISYVCFFIHVDHIDSRLALSVGALFAVIGNKYIIDSSLPESNTFTLVDWLHGITMFYIFLVMASSVFTLRLIKKDKHAKARRYNKVLGSGLLIIYLAINISLIAFARNAKQSTTNKPEPFQTKVFVNKAGTDKKAITDTLYVKTEGTK